MAACTVCCQHARKATRLRPINLTNCRTMCHLQGLAVTVGCVCAYAYVCECVSVCARVCECEFVSVCVYVCLNARALLRGLKHRVAAVSQTQRCLTYQAWSEVE